MSKNSRPLKINIPMKVAYKKKRFVDTMVEIKCSPEEAGEPVDFQARITQEEHDASEKRHQKLMQELKDGHRQDLIAQGKYNPETFDADWDRETDPVRTPLDPETEKIMWEVLTDQLVTDENGKLYWKAAKKKDLKKKK